ncbi:MAG: MBOAT family protein [Candidatus Sungbacteria bacterium]|uniref:MBOAT family protein n=1 Tax=Candidatus Sungiibacteriota bacterium TaxID=2750080 RepID=A0A9D6QTR8_9BACT|nr:MBOAT family protein [Candidatus Sungbacteria bacterium]
MVFNSFQFLLFFPAVVAIYFLLPHCWRWVFLLLASGYFYMAFIPKYIFVLGFLIVIDYWAGILIERAQARKRFFLTISILANAGMLFVFKYFNFFNSNLDHLARFLHWNYPIGYLALALPLGLSFHTFQSLSYVIEVYRGRQKAERNFGIYALYVMFFPQLVAGPIERPQNLLHQFYERHIFLPDRVVLGLRLMLWGFFKKIVVADNIAGLVNLVYAAPPHFSAPAILLAIFLFTIQLYADFSGYSDIARGSALVLGYRLMENFNRPYFAKSIAEFWRRWHISLSSWLRDYIYYPLVFKTRNQPVRGMYFALLFTFLISGVWHGAGWTFLIMGFLFGFYIVFGLVTKSWRASILESIKIARWQNLHGAIQACFTFLLVSFAWIFFRASSLQNAYDIIRGTFLNFRFSYAEFSSLNKLQILFGFIGISVLFLVELTSKDAEVWGRLHSVGSLMRWGIYSGLALAILLLGYFRGQTFIYFQF